MNWFQGSSKRDLREFEPLSRSLAEKNGKENRSPLSLKMFRPISQITRFKAAVVMDEDDSDLVRGKKKISRDFFSSKDD